MKDSYTWVLIALLSILIGLLAYPYVRDYTDSLMESPTEKAIQESLERENDVYDDLEFALSDPEEAPESIRENVLYGYGLMINTKQLAGQYLNNDLTCANCHFAGGNTVGERNGGISLAGVAATYPKYDDRYKKVMDLPTRINNCFLRSMNGNPIPLDSKEMLALVTYLHWISKGMIVYDLVPWLGLKKLEITTTTDPTKGEVLFGTYCSDCHGTDGQGTLDYPAVWGDNSFNDEAGLHQQDKLESFIFYNMPLGDPSLTEQQARDVAAFIIEQPRPILKNRAQKN